MRRLNQAHGLGGRELPRAGGDDSRVVSEEIPIQDVPRTSELLRCATKHLGSLYALLAKRRGRVVGEDIIEAREGGLFVAGAERSWRFRLRQQRPRAGSSDDRWRVVA